MLNLFKFASILILCWCGSINAQVSKATVKGVGTAQTRDGAVAAALVNAAGQAFGMKIDSQTAMASSTVKEKSTIQSSDGTDSSSAISNVTALNQYITQKVKTPTNSPILGYTIDKVSEQPTKLWEAIVTMTYSKFEQIGGESTRRSVVVVTNDKKNKDLIINTVSDAIVSSRRFDVLNRQNSELFNQEKAFILNDDAAQGEVARLGQASGADYLVIAELQSLSIANDMRETIKMTGEVLVRSTASGILKLQIIEFSSRKVKWAASEKFGNTFAGSSSVSNESLIKMISGAADKLVDKMVASIYPIQIVKVVGGNIAVLNRGEGSINKGEAYAIFLLGDDLKDPQSGEWLGALEIDAGTGKVVDVKPKFSYLKLDNGTLDEKAEYIVRKLNPQQQKSTNPPANKSSTNQSTGKSQEKSKDEVRKNFFTN